MEAREYLEQYQYLKSIRNTLLLERNEIVTEESRPSGIDYSADRVSGGSGKDAMYQKYERIQKRMVNVDKKIQKIDERLNEIRNSVRSIGNKSHVQVLYLYYIQNLSLKEISGRLDYTYSYVRKLHMEALKGFESEYNKEQKGTM